MLLEKVYRKILLEGSRDNALIPLIQRYGLNMSVSQFKRDMLVKLTNAGLRNLSLGGNFYLLGAIMYYLNGDLTENQPNILNPEVEDVFIPDVCRRLNALILILRNIHIDSVGTIWEQPEDFGNLPLDKLLKKYNSKISKALGSNTTSLELSNNAGSDYTYEIITNFKQCEKYNSATEPGAWCITYGEQHYNGYTSEARNDAGKEAHFVIFRQNGYENIPRKKGENFTPEKPQDEYGNSLIALLQANDSPEPIYITSRWNHGSYYDNTDGTEADHAYTPEEFLQVIGCDKSIFTKVYREWAEKVGAEGNLNIRQEKTNMLRKFKYAQMRINNGNTIDSIFGKTDIAPIVTDNKGRIRTAIVSIKIGGEDSTIAYVTFYDRGKIYFDDFLIKTDSLYYDDSLNNFLRDYSDPIIILRNGRSYYSPIAIYNTKLRKFLNLGGVTIFKKFTSAASILNQSDKYVTLGMTSNQVAIVDMEKLEPAAVADNGSPWFEYIKPIGNSYAQKKNRKNIYSYLPDIRDYYQYLLVYDSAANEKYIFDPQTGTVSNTKLMDGDGNGFSIYQSEYVDRQSGIPGYVKLSKTIVEHSLYDDSPHEREIFAYFNLGTKQLFEIYGNKFFTSLENHSGVIGLKPEGDEDENIFYYDYTLGKPITFNGKPFTTVGYSIWMDQLGTDYWENVFKEEPAYVGIPANGFGKWEVSFIYDPTKHSFFTYNGEYLFNLGSYKDRDAGKVLTKDGTELKLTKPLEDAKRQEYAVQVAAENVKRQFNTLLEQMNRYKQIL